MENNTKNCLIKHEILFNSNLSGVSFKLLCFALHANTWEKEQKTLLKKVFKEKEQAQRGAFRELEKFGYLKRIRYVTKDTKQWVGIQYFFTDTPWEFNTKKFSQFLKENNYEKE